jgi:arylsulfatase A-like enzyme
MTGTYSEYNGINSLTECSLNKDITTMPEHLSRNGFNTIGLVTGPITEETGLNRGFDQFHYREEDKSLSEDWLATASEKIRSISEPFFAYLHLWELHREIAVPSKFDKSTYGGTDYGRMLSALDRSIEKLVAQLPENTLVVIHGDHGESIRKRNSPIRRKLKKYRDVYRYERGKDTRQYERILNRITRFGEHPFVDHYIEDGHGETIYDFMTNVPFIFSGSEIPSSQVTAQCRQIDVFPTILDYFSINPPNSVRGESLLNGEINDRPAYIRACGTSLRGKNNWQRGVRAEGYKYVEYPNMDWEPELYDLNKDPAEFYNIASQNKEMISSMKRHLPDKSLDDSDKINIQDRLEELGYL